MSNKSKPRRRLSKNWPKCKIVLDCCKCRNRKSRGGMSSKPARYSSSWNKSGKFKKRKSSRRSDAKESKQQLKGDRLSSRHRKSKSESKG